MDMWGDLFVLVWLVLLLLLLPPSLPLFLCVVVIVDLFVQEIMALNWYVSLSLCVCVSVLLYAYETCGLSLFSSSLFRQALHKL